jgi:hypothetical protein
MFQVSEMKQRERDNLGMEVLHTRVSSNESQTT